MNGPSPVRLAVASPSHLRRCDGEAKRGGPPPRLLNPSGAFNDPFYPQIRVKNHIILHDEGSMRAEILTFGIIHCPS